jgi:AcrR family transcriptional regulator
MRERKKRATREALSAAAPRLARERGPENVRVDDIADAAGVSPRAYNNDLSSREHAIMAALTAEPGLRIGAALLITSAPALQAEFLDTIAAIEGPLAEAIAAPYRHGGEFRGTRRRRLLGRSGGRRAMAAPRPRVAVLGHAARRADLDHTCSASRRWPGKRRGCPMTRASGVPISPNSDFSRVSSGLSGT